MDSEYKSEYKREYRRALLYLKDVELPIFAYHTLEEQMLSVYNNYSQEEFKRALAGKFLALFDECADNLFASYGYNNVCMSSCLGPNEEEILLARMRCAAVGAVRLMQELIDVVKLFGLSSELLIIGESEETAQEYWETNKKILINLVERQLDTHFYLEGRCDEIKKEFGLEFLEGPARLSSPILATLEAIIMMNDETIPILEVIDINIKVEKFLPEKFSFLLGDLRDVTRSTQIKRIIERINTIRFRIEN